MYAPLLYSEGMHSWPPVHLTTWLPSSSACCSVLNMAVSAVAAPLLDINFSSKHSKDKANSPLDSSYRTNLPPIACACSLSDSTNFSFSTAVEFLPLDGLMFSNSTVHGLFKLPVAHTRPHSICTCC